ncbi:MAG: ABC transporter permease [Pirellulales bacterium]
MSAPAENPIRRILHGIELKLVVAWLIVVALTAWADPAHLYWTKPDVTFPLIFENTLWLGFLAIGGGIVIISGGIDLSCGSVMVLAATVFASLAAACEPMVCEATGTPFDPEVFSTATIVIAFAGMLLAAVMVGTLHAWLINCLELPPFVATLSTLVGLRSLGRGMSDAFFGSSEITFKDPNLADVLKGPWFYAPLFLVLAGALWFMLSGTVIGRRIYALGGNEQAARLSGIRVERLKWLAYVLSAVLASLVGLILFAKVNSVKPIETARGYELNAIAAAVIGGCSLQGGIGTIPGIFLGCLLLRTIIDAITKVVRTGSDVYEGMIVGVVVVLAVTFTQRRNANRKKLFGDALGWSVIPIHGLLGGLICYLFLRTRDGFEPWHAAAFGLFVIAALVGAAVWESLPSKSGAAGKSTA